MNSGIPVQDMNNYKENSRNSSEVNSNIEGKKVDDKEIVFQSEQKLFRVVPEEKDSRSQNNLLINSSEKKSNRKSSKHINIIKPKFVTRTLQSYSIKSKSIEESQSLNLSPINLNSNLSAFQPQIPKQKEFKAKIKDKLYNLILEVHNNNLHLKVNEITDIFLLKYFYEDEYSLAELKKLNKFFVTYNSVSEAINELEKNIIQKSYNVIEDIENKILTVQIKTDNNIVFSLPQKIYTKDNLLEILSKKIETMNNDFSQRISKLEEINNMLMINFYNLRNNIEPNNINYDTMQKDIKKNAKKSTNKIKKNENSEKSDEIIKTENVDNSEKSEFIT